MFVNNVFILVYPALVNKNVIAAKLDIIYYPINLALAFVLTDIILTRNLV